MISSSSLVLVLSVTLQAAPDAQTAHQEDEQLIRKSAAKYAEAYNRGDVDALVAQFTKDAEYDEGEGDVVSGREAIRKKLEEELKEQAGDKMSIEIKSIRFSRSRAVETGVATLTSKDGKSTAVPYRAIHAKQPDGKWLMSSVGPDVSAENATSSGPLEQLEWMIGNWKDAEENMDVTSTCTWTANHRFILRSYVVKDEDGSELKVSEVIGWDPADNVIKSWVFDSDGGLAQNTWRKRGDDWLILAKGTLPDGGRGSAINVIHPIDKDTYSWSSTNRDVDGDMLPDVDDVKMVRVPETQTPAAAGEGR
jgi:uncharacterized protein (TIGR02246 family)